MPLTSNINSYRVSTGRIAQINSSGQSRISNSHEVVRSCSYSGLWTTGGAVLGMLSGGVIGLALAAYGSAPNRTENGDFRELLLTVVSSVIGVIGGGVSGFMAGRLCSSYRQNRVERETHELQSLDVRAGDMLPTAPSLSSNHPPDYEELPPPPAYESFHCEYEPSPPSHGEPPPAYDTLSLRDSSWSHTQLELPAHESLHFDQNNSSDSDEG